MVFPLRAVWAEAGLSWVSRQRLAVRLIKPDGTFFPGGARSAQAARIPPSKILRSCHLPGMVSACPHSDHRRRRPLIEKSKVRVLSERERGPSDGSSLNSRHTRNRRPRRLQRGSSFFGHHASGMCTTDRQKGRTGDGRPAVQGLFCQPRPGVRGSPCRPPGASRSGRIFPAPSRRSGHTNEVAAGCSNGAEGCAAATSGCGDRVGGCRRDGHRSSPGGWACRGGRHAGRWCWVQRLVASDGSQR